MTNAAPNLGADACRIARRSPIQAHAAHQLPDDIAELKRLLLAQDAELVAKDAELAAAKNGLVITQLTIENLKVQIARLKRETFDKSPEKSKRMPTTAAVCA